MRSSSIILSCLIAVLVLSPSTSQAQRVFGGCFSRSYSCSRYEDVRGRFERQRALAFERAERARAMAEARAEARARSRALSQRSFRDYSREMQRLRIRDRVRERSFRMRDRYYRW